MKLNLERVRANVQQANTEDLLDHATVYRTGMEPEAVEVIESELRKRNNGATELATYENNRKATVLTDEAGVALKCMACHRPAVGRAWGWHRLWGWVPVFPRQMEWCEKHRAKETS